MLLHFQPSCKLGLESLVWSWDVVRQTDDKENSSLAEKKKREKTLQSGGFERSSSEALCFRVGRRELLHLPGPWASGSCRRCPVQGECVNEGTLTPGAWLPVRAPSQAVGLAPAELWTSRGLGRPRSI